MLVSARRSLGTARSSFCCSWIRGVQVGRLVRTVARGTEWVLNRVRRRRPRTVDLSERVLEERDRVRHALGALWPWAVVAVVSKWAFDYFALVAAVAASGARVESIPLLLAYVAASVLKMIPITPGGLGFVEAGLAVTLVWAGLSAANNSGHARVPAGVLLAAAHRGCRGGGRLPSPLPGEGCLPAGLTPRLVVTPACPSLLAAVRLDLPRRPNIDVVRKP